jgi:predicted MPP superfamily phosphohydrolase
VTAFRLFLLAYLALGQIVALFFLKKRLTQVFWRSALKAVYLAINFLVVLAIVQLYVFKALPAEKFIWAYLYRPALTWFFGHAMWLTVAIVVWLIGVALSPFVNRAPKGLPQLFRAKKDGATVGFIVFLAWFLCLGAAFYGYWVQQGEAVIRRSVVAIPTLPPELESLRIVHLSDFHYGLGADLADLDRRLAQAEELKPDLILLTGDLLDSNSSLARDFREPLKRLSRARYGIYGVFGNHDLYANNPAEAANVFSLLSVKILRDETVNVPNLPLTIIGFDDPGVRSVFYRADPNTKPLDFKNLKGPPIPQENFKILLRHRPQGLTEAAAQGVNLYLAGHTHGGQFQAPWNPRLNLMTFSAPYTEGTYYLAPTTLIISSGLASAGLPFRLWAWPEMGLITLTKGRANH